MRGGMPKKRPHPLLPASRLGGAWAGGVAAPQSHRAAPGPRIAEAGHATLAAARQKRALPPHASCPGFTPRCSSPGRLASQLHSRAPSPTAVPPSPTTSPSGVSFSPPWPWAPLLGKAPGASLPAVGALGVLPVHKHRRKGGAGSWQLHFASLTKPNSPCRWDVTSPPAPARGKLRLPRPPRPTQPLCGCPSSEGAAPTTPPSTPSSPGADPWPPDLRPCS